MATDSTLITGVVAALCTLDAANFWNRRKLKRTPGVGVRQGGDETDAGVAAITVHSTRRSSLSKRNSTTNSKNTGKITSKSARGPHEPAILRGLNRKPH